MQQAVGLAYAGEPAASSVIDARAHVHSQPSERYRFSFHGTGGEYFFLILKTVFLTLLTLGIYTPWGKTQLRRWICQNIEVHGQRLSYLGTGMELFIGYLKVIACGAVFYGLIMAGVWAGGAVAVLTIAVAYIAIIVAMPYAMYGSLRYLLSRTTWRGIHAGLEAEGLAEFRRTFWIGSVLTVLTLGLYGPVVGNRLYRIKTNHMAVGNLHFRYDGEDGEAWRLAMKGLVLSLLTLGIYAFWHQAAWSRFRASHTHFGDATLRVDFTGGELLVRTLAYLFGTTLSLGLAFPWLAVWLVRFSAERTSFEGHIDFAQIEQRLAGGDAAADGFADAIDLGLAV